MKADEIINQILELGVTIFYGLKMIDGHIIKLHIQNLKPVNHFGAILAINCNSYLQQVHVRRQRVLLECIQNHSEDTFEVFEEILFNLSHDPFEEFATLLYQLIFLRIVN